MLFALLLPPPPAAGEGGANEGLGRLEGGGGTNVGRAGVEFVSCASYDDAAGASCIWREVDWWGREGEGRNRGS